MEKICIVADDKIPFLSGALEKVARMKYLPGSQITRKDLMDADALITRTRTRCDSNLLEGTGVRFIASATIGYDHIDTGYCDSKGIRWTNAPGCNSSSVRQYLVSVLLFLAVQRKIDLKKKTLGVIGVGNVGRKVAAAGEALGMRVLLNDPPRAREEGNRGFVELDELLAGADILTLHVPLNRGGTDNTLHLVDEAFAGRVKKGAVLINSSRGAVVHEKVLTEAITRNNFSDVILDVFESEPGVDPALLRSITLGTPHIAGYSLDGKANGTTMAVRAVSRFFGLGLDDWAPSDIPLPGQQEISVDGAAGSLYNNLWEAYSKTYDVTSDDRRLRSNPDAFEQLRGNYPLRREPPLYSIRLSHGNREITSILEKLGFSVP